MRKNLFFLSSFIGFFLSSFTHSSIDNLHSFISFIYLFRSCSSSSTSTTLSSWANSYIFLIRFVPIRQEREVCKLDQLTIPLKLAIPSILYYIPPRPQDQHKAAAICNKILCIWHNVAPIANVQQILKTLKQIAIPPIGAVRPLMNRFYFMNEYFNIRNLWSCSPIIIFNHITAI